MLFGQKVTGFGVQRGGREAADPRLEITTLKGKTLLTLKTSPSGELHPLITAGRDTGNGYAISCRYYPCDEVEVTAIKLGYEDSLKRGGGGKRKTDSKESMDAPTLAKSCARARTAVRRKALSMEADRMLTLTFKENVEDIEVAWDRFKYFSKLCRFRWGSRWKYIAVPEYQKRGAVHFHLAIVGFFHVNTIRRLWQRAVGKFGGNIDITSPQKFGKKSWNPKRIANYISKYIAKNDSVEFNKRRYSSGGDIQLPEPQRGWLALGVPVIKVMAEVVEKLSRRQVTTIWESEGYFGITYVST